MLKTVDEIPEEVQSQLLADYEKECEGRVPTVKKGTLKCKEKDDMVLVTMSGDSGSTSPSKGTLLHNLSLDSENFIMLAIIWSIGYYYL